MATETEAHAGATADKSLLGLEIMLLFLFFLDTLPGEEVTRLCSRFLSILEPEEISDPLMITLDLFFLLL